MASIEGEIESSSQTAQRVDNCEHAITRINYQISSLMRKIDDLENRSRHNNLIVYGVECETESPTSLREAVLTGIFEDKLDIKVSSLECMH